LSRAALESAPLNRCSVVEIAKAIVLTGCTRHDRPWPSVRVGPKQLVPIANRPILFHNLEALSRGNVLEAMMAVEPECAASIRDAVGDGSPWGVRIHYSEWQPDSGVRGALASAERFLAGEPVFVEHADALLQEQIHPHIADFARDRFDAMTLRLPAGRPGSRDELIPGGYLLSPHATSILLEHAEAAGDPGAMVRRHGGCVGVREIDGCLPCHGGQDQLLEGNRRALGSLRGSPDPASYPTCEFQGPVAVHPSAELDHTLIRGPVVIGPRCRLSHAYIGPYTSIGEDVVIEGTQIEHSIVLAGAELRYVGTRLETSVIGRAARVSRSLRLPSAMRLSVGDAAEVTLS
jgi:glucose-1-phosphate thymidylyltransferase